MGLFTKVGQFADGFFGGVIQRQTPQTPTQPFLKAELAIDEGSMYKRMKLTPYHPDDLLSRKKIDIFNEMMFDSEIEGSINTLKTIRLSSGWEIIPGSDNPRDKEIKDFVRWNLENIEGSFEDDLREIMGGVEMGVSLNELVWDVIEKGKYAGKYIGIKSIKSKSPEYFNIATDDFDNILENGVVGISSVGYGNEYPTEKFIIYSFNKQYENVFGKSRIRALYDLWFLKQVIRKATGVYVEKFGHPLPVIKHPPGIDEATRTALLTILKQLRLEAGLLLPDNLEIELKEASLRGTTMFLDIMKYIDEEIRKTILGQTLTTQTGDTGSFALGKVHFDILLFYEDQLGDDVAKKAINQQLVNRLVDYNYNDVEEYPQFQFKPLIQEDIIQVIDKYYQGVSQQAIKPIPEDEEWIRDKLKLPKRKVEISPAPVVTKPVPQMMEFAEKVFTGVRRRTFTEYEKFTDFVDIRNGMEDLTNKYTGKVIDIVKESAGELISDIQKKKIIDGKNFGEIEKLHLKYTGDIKREFESMLDEMYRKSMRDARKEIAEKKRELKFQVDLRAIPPAKAMEYFKNKAFWMTGVERDNILKKVKTTLYNSLKQGADLKTTTEALQVDFDSYYMRGIVDPEEITSARLETIVRTNLNEAFNEGRRAMFEDPDLNGYIQAYQYSAILDDRVRDNHARMDGRIYAVNNPVWREWMPPNGFNCRCIIIPITMDEAWEEDDPPPAGLKPDAGFESIETKAT